MKRLAGLLLTALVAGGVTYLLVGRQHPVDLRRAGFSLQVPPGWHIDTAEDDYNPDSYFTVLGPKESSGRVQFSLYDHPFDPKQRADILSDAIFKKHPSAQRASFTRWGNYDVEGRELREPASEEIPIVFRAVLKSTGTRSFVVWEIFPAANERELQPVLQQLASSFHLASDR
jgi:hypothetical protein